MSHAQGHPKKTLLRGLLDKLLVLKIVRLLHSGTIQLRLCASISERRCREQVNRIDRINRPDVAATAATADITVRNPDATSVPGIGSPAIPASAAVGGSGSGGSSSDSLDFPGFNSRRSRETQLVSWVPGPCSRAPGQPGALGCYRSRRRGAAGEFPGQPRQPMYVLTDEAAENPDAPWIAYCDAVHPPDAPSDAAEGKGDGMSRPHRRSRPASECSRTT